MRKSTKCSILVVIERDNFFGATLHNTNRVEAYGGLPTLFTKMEDDPSGIVHSKYRLALEYTYRLRDAIEDPEEKCVP